MNPTIRKVFTILLIVLFISFSHVGSAGTNDDTTAQVICNIIGYVWGIGGPLMTVVIIIRVKLRK